jgi:hypothetical protein
MWKAITYVSSGITLIAFICAVAAWIYRTKILERERTIRLAPENARSALVERTLEFFSVDTVGLTRQQKYDLALHQIHARAARFRTTAIVIVIIAFLASGVGAFAILREPVIQKPDKSDSTAATPSSLPTSPVITSATPKTSLEKSSDLSSPLPALEKPSPTPSPVIVNRTRATLQLGEPFTFGGSGVSAKFYDYRNGAQIVLVLPDGQQVRATATEGWKYDFEDQGSKFTFAVNSVSSLFLEVTLTEKR